MLLRYNVFKEVKLRIKSETAVLSEGQRSNEFHVFKDTTAHAIK